MIRFACKYVYSSYFFCTLLYIVAPTITKRSQSEVIIFHGNVLYLVCEAEGFPTPNVTWKKNGKVLQTNINKTEFIIDVTSEKDAGKYECEASNSVGTVSYTVEVSIKGKVARSIKNCFLTRFIAENKIVRKRSAKRTAEFLRTVSWRSNQIRNYQQLFNFFYRF